MEHRVLSDGTVLAKAAPGEDAPPALASLCESLGVHCGMVAGIGACESAELAFFDPKTKSYEKRRFAEPMEVLSLSGNVSRGEDGRAFLHLHGVLGRRDLSTVGGHVFALVAEPTLELFVRPFAGAVDRVFVPEKGLRLWRI